MYRVEKGYAMNPGEFIWDEMKRAKECSSGVGQKKKRENWPRIINSVGQRLICVS